jgi:hypothetical protein
LTAEDKDVVVRDSRVVLGTHVTNSIEHTAECDLATRDRLREASVGWTKAQDLVVEIVKAVPTERERIENRASKRCYSQSLWVATSKRAAR